MKNRRQQYAPFGLYIALLAALVSAGLYLIQREWDLPLKISLGIMILGLAFFTAMDPDRVRTALTGRQAKYGSNALVISVAFIGILVVINYLVNQYSKRWDLSEDQQNTLAKETLDTLETLPEKVTAQAFFTSRLSTDQAESLLDNFQFSSQGKFEFSFIDPEADPVAAENAQITRDGTIVLKLADRQELVTTISEQELTGALVRLMSTGNRKIYFLTGHGEISPDGTGEKSLAQLKSSLQAKSYQTDLLNLLSTNQIPEDAAIIVVAGPVKPISEDEIALISEFVANGGSLVVMEEPLPLTDYGDSPDPLADYLQTSWGIKLGADIVVDLSSNQPFIAVENQYGDHVITNQMEGLVSFFPTARSVTAQTSVSGVSQKELVLTSSQSWAETNLEQLQAGEEVTPDQGVDIMGPISVAAAAENFETEGRIVVFGDVEFATDGYISGYGNSDLVVNALDWSAKQENLISLTPKETTQRVLLTPTKYTINLIFFGSLIGLPGLVLAAGVIVWAVRRRRG